MAWHHAGMATDEEERAAEDRLRAATAKYRKLESATEELHAAIVEILTARTLRPSKVNSIVPFSPAHVSRIARAGGVPPLREATVVSKRKAAEG